MQTYLPGDNLTASAAQYWDGDARQMRVLIRVDHKHTYSALGVCVSTKTTPVKRLPNSDVSPGSGDIANFGQSDAVDCNLRCTRDLSCLSFVLHLDGTCYLKSVAAPLVDSAIATAYLMQAPRPSPPVDCVQDLVPLGLAKATATRTTFNATTPDGAVQIDMLFQDSGFVDDWVLASRPVHTLAVTATSLDGKSHAVQVYFDASAEFTVNSATETVSWELAAGDASRNLVAARVSKTKQVPLSLKGDTVGIDWGYLYLGAVTGAGSADAQVSAGSLAAARGNFTTTGRLPSVYDDHMPRACNDDLPGLFIVQDLGTVSPNKPATARALLAYDDILSASYYGEEMHALWSLTYDTIKDAMVAAWGDYEAVVAKSLAVDAALQDAAEAKGGAGYAALAQLAYRQTLAATKLVHHSKENTTWLMLKEISTNGDMQTMDVIFPASPMFLYSNPELLKRLLLPVLSFANNETGTFFSNPFSPHQIGTYPIADATTASQEPMPMENTGNMFLMLAGIVKFDAKHDTSFFYPKYYPLLRSWADYLNASLPFPAYQLCTDDFTGRLANNSNLAAKGIVALEAFAQLCRAVGESGCEAYSDSAKQFATTWQHFAYEASPKPHYKIAFNYTDSWSVKYNLVWQKILQMDGPFPWDTVAQQEVAFYVSQVNKYGVPLDLRHTYQKLDWASWAAVMADSQDNFHALMDPIVKVANETRTRVPLTDLYDTGDQAFAPRPSFIARPVVGGVFAKMLV